jgi:hypothetical protein
VSEEPATTISCRSILFCPEDYAGYIDMKNHNISKWSLFRGLTLCMVLRACLTFYIALEI